MKKLRLFGVLRHAMVMVGRTIKSYAMLSVTIVLSFSILLGYLLFTDASLYNEYKGLFTIRHGDVVIEDQTMDPVKLKLLLDKLDAMENCDYYICYNANVGHDPTLYDGTEIGMKEGETFQVNNQFAMFFPDYAWVDGMELGGYSISGNIVWLEPREDFILAANEVILSEHIYFANELDRQPNPVYTFHSDAGPTLELKVVGYVKAQRVLDFSADGWDCLPPMYLSTKFMEAAQMDDPEVWSPFAGMDTIIWCQFIVIHTEDPEQVVTLADRMDYIYCRSIYEQQNDALEHIRNEKGNKAVIACALLLLLGINLYSSFTNALNDRKFEIGVKRAIGASSGSIVRQFLYESAIVMVANTVISIAVVADVFIVYKYIYERIPDLYGNYNVWTIYISPHSIAMFGLCAVTLTVVFSLIFAYKSTRVEIVQYLKAE